MKQKILIKVSMDSHTSGFYCFGPQNPQSKVLKLAGGFPGVQSVALVGDRDHVEVIGDVDAINLTTLLRKKVGFAEIVSVSEDKNKGDKDDNPGETYPQSITWPYSHPEVVYVTDPYPQPWCWPL